MIALRILLLNLILAIAWAFAVGELTTGRLVQGFVLGFVALWVTGRAIGADVYVRKAKAILYLVAFFLRELVTANLRVAFDVVTPRHYMRPGVIGIPLDARTDGEITLLGNLISLTPGTLTLDVSADRKTIYIHAMYIRDVEHVRKSIKNGLEKRILEVTR
ncbi:MAG TPA: Na+/H+ antiporter subunit E [Thermoanaerobaculia bacterium]|nr:Na+/H+ antiporter subunit E [Thermoanaerobaculia bacterium]